MKTSIWLRIAGMMGLIQSTIIGQNASEALRYSDINVQGSAAYVGAGGALSVLGADLSVIHDNPAGIAAYRKNEFVITPGITITSNKSLLQGSSKNEVYHDGKTHLNLNNFGFILHSKPGSNWKTANFGLSFTRLADFNNQYYYTGKSKGSITDRFYQTAYDANGNPLASGDLDGFEAGLAFATGALFEQNNGWTTDHLNTCDPIHNPAGCPLIPKSQTIETKGKMDELAIAFGGNYQDKLSIGLSMGIPFLRFEEQKSYNETDPQDSVAAFQDLKWDETLNSEATGINAKLGVTYRINQSLRVGAAIHTPSLYFMNDRYKNTLRYRFIEGGESKVYEESSPEGSFEYQLTTPWRLNAGVAYIHKKQGWVTAEADWVHYNNASYNLTSEQSNTENEEYERKVNNDIQNQYNSSLRLKIGAEFAHDIFRIRGGIQLQQSPYVGQQDWLNTYSLGAGIRGNSMYLDLAYRFGSNSFTYQPYDGGALGSQKVDFTNHSGLAVMTLGFRF